MQAPKPYKNVTALQESFHKRHFISPDSVGTKLYHRNFTTVCNMSLMSLLHSALIPTAVGTVFLYIYVHVESHHPSDAAISVQWYARRHSAQCRRVGFHALYTVSFPCTLWQDGWGRPQCSLTTSEGRTRICRRISDRAPATHCGPPVKCLQTPRVALYNHSKYIFSLKIKGICFKKYFF